MSFLNIAFAFEDALRVVQCAKALDSPALPILIFHLQGDVINSYRHAMDHYLTVPLDAPYLRNSSLGPPYVKWSTFTNEDFEMLRFCVYNLLRYTSRLWHETEHRPMVRQHLYKEASKRSNAYTTPIVTHRVDKGSIGFRVLPDDVIAVNSIRLSAPACRIIARGSAVEGVRYFRIEVIDGREVEVEVEPAEAERCMSPLVEDRIRISDRNALLGIRRSGHEEIAQLTQLHRRFGEACRSAAKKIDPLTEFNTLNESYWV